jgi:hypothetical protein
MDIVTNMPGALCATAILWLVVFFVKNTQTAKSALWMVVNGRPGREGIVKSIILHGRAMETQKAESLFGAKRGENGM